MTIEQELAIVKAALVRVRNLTLEEYEDAEEIVDKVYHIAEDALLETYDVPHTKENK